MVCLETIRTILVFVVLIVMASGGFIYYIILNIIRPIIGGRNVRLAKSYLMGLYLRFVRFLICDFKLVLTGDVDKLEATKSKKSFYIQNHQTELDWIFCNYVLQVFGKEADFSAVMKGSLGKLPTIGHAVQELNMCLLDRNWETDKSHFNSFLESFISHPLPICVFMCPEGTTITDTSYARSQKYAKKTGRPMFEHVLLPRSTGLAYVVKTLKEYQEKTGEEVYLYDTTMEFEGYSGEICSDENYGRQIDTTFPSFDNSFWKRYPVNCHIHVNVVPLTSVTKKESNDMESINRDVEEWLDQSWVKKEEELEYFTQHQEYDKDWKTNEKVVVFDLKKRLIDGIPWMIVFSIAFVMDYSILMAAVKLIRFLVYSVCSSSYLSCYWSY